MKVPFSKYLDSIADGLKLLIADLSEDHDYVSVLATDSTGFSESMQYIIFINIESA